MFTNVNNPFRTFPIIAYMSATEHIIGNKKKKPQVIGPSIMLSYISSLKVIFHLWWKVERGKEKCNKIVEKSDTDELPMLVDDAK